MYSPLDQFNITILPTPYQFLNISNLFLIFIVFFLVFYFKYLSAYNTYLPNKLQLFIETLYKFVLSINNENINTYKFFSFILSIFLLIMTCNLFGMIPFSFTVTSHLIITFSLSLSIFFGVTIIGLGIYKHKFFSLYFPSGTPIGLSPLIVIIEIVSYFSRPISLSIRLAANMIAGHILLRIISEFITILFYYVKALVFFPTLILAVLFLLEIFIGLLQAYVFTTLLCIYINEALNLH